MRFALLGILAISLNLHLTAIVSCQDNSDVIPGVDKTQLDVVRQWWQEQGERSAVPTQAAGILWRVSRLSDRWMEQQLERSLPPSPAEPWALTLEGEALAIKKIQIPERLAESLDFEQMWLVNGLIDDEEMGLLCRELPEQWLSSDNVLPQSIQATGFQVVSPSPQAPGLVVVRSLRWLPAQDDPNVQLPVGWGMLAQQGFDIAQLSFIENRNRSALSSAESSAFYGFLKAASLVGEDPSTIPTPVGPQDLLHPTKSKQRIGHYIRMRLETARIQQIFDPSLRSKIGQDFYWEIDAFGDLGNTKISLTPEDDEEPITFDNRYPVTLAMLKLPTFLESLVVDDGKVTKAMLMHKAMIRVDGFFYRLWAYETDFVSSKGGDRQIGPLVAVSRIELQASGSAGTTLRKIGWGAAITFLVGLLAIILYLLITSRMDRKMRSMRQKTLPQVLPKLNDDPGPS